MSKSPGNSPTIAVGFGDNYFRNMGSATPVRLPHDSGDRDGDGGGEDNPIPAVHAYKFLGDGEGGSGHAEPPPWERDDDSLVDVKCTVTSTFFLTQAGKIYTCGTLHGQVRPALTRTTIALPLKCVELAAGRHFCLARMEGGLAVCAWGAGHFGQLGLGNESSPFVDHPTVIDRLLPHVVGAPVTGVAAGYWHSMALTQAGAVYAWGCNRNSQCGMKPAKDPPTVCTPQLVTFESPPPGTSGNGEVKIDKIAAGRSHSVALDVGGQVYCWGACQYGQIGLLNRRRGGVAPPKHVEALAKVKIVDVSAGDAHTLALTGGGRVFGWGAAFEGQLGTGSIAQMNPKPKLVGDLDFVAIEAGREWKMKQKHYQGDVDENGQPPSETMVSSATGAPATAAANAQTLASIPRIVSVTAKGNSSIVISSSGHVYAWGCNDVGNLGLPKPDMTTLTYVDPGLPVTKTSTLRQFQTHSFDSSHNVALPQRLDSIRDLHVTAVGASPTFLWCLGTKRQDSDDPTVGRTLYEVQEAQRQKSLQHGRMVPTLDDGGFGTSNTSATASITDVSFQNENDHQPSRDPPEMKDGSAVDEGGTAASPTNDDVDDNSSEGSTSQHSLSIDKAVEISKISEKATISTKQSTGQPSLSTARGNSLSPATPSKKKLLFSPKRLVKAIVRRASSGARSDVGPPLDSGSKKKGKK
jgi:Regulator of chromosome condensation (RCC1) repeat